MQALSYLTALYAAAPLPFLILALAVALTIFGFLLGSYRTLRIIGRGIRAIKRTRRVHVSQRRALARMRALPTVHGYQRDLSLIKRAPLTGRAYRTN